MKDRIKSDSDPVDVYKKHNIPKLQKIKLLR